MNKRKSSGVLSGAGSSTLKTQKISNMMDEEESITRYHFVPSLEHIAGITVVRNVWTQNNFREEIKNLFYSYAEDNTSHRPFELDNKWEKLEEVVWEEVSRLCIGLPESVTKVLFSMVKPIGYEIKTWVTFRHISLFWGPKMTMCCSMIVNFIDSLSWLPGGTIDYKETAINLMSKDDICDMLKFDIACINCLEEHVVTLAKKITDASLWSPWRSFGYDPTPMMLFWYASATDDRTTFDEFITHHNKYHNKNRNSYEILLFEAINDGNDVATKYFWKKLSAEERVSSIMRLTINAICRGRSRIVCFLLPRMSKEQRTLIFQDYSIFIISCFLMNGLWEDYFSRCIHHIWSAGDSANRISILALIASRTSLTFDPHDKTRLLFLELWNSTTDSMKTNIIDDGTNFDKHRILSKFSMNEDQYIVRLLLSTASITQKREFMSFIQHAGPLVKWDLLKVLITQHPTEKCMDGFKENYLEYQAAPTCLPLIVKEQWQSLEEFLNWSFNSEDEISDFKQQLVYGYEDYSVITLLGKVCSNDETDFRNLDRFLAWGLTSGEEIKDFKMKLITQPKQPKQIILEKVFNLIREDKFTVVNKMLNWFFSDDQNEVIRYKNTFGEWETNDADLLANLIAKDDHLQGLDTFIHWCFSSEELIQKFKEERLQVGSKMVSVCQYPLYNLQFQLVDEVLNWCCGFSTAQMYKIKNEMMLCSAIQYILYTRDVSLINMIVKWFQPSLDTIVKFKKRFKNARWFDTVASVLDGFSRLQGDVEQ